MQNVRRVMNVTVQSPRVELNDDCLLATVDIIKGL